MQSEKWLTDLRGRFKDYGEDPEEEIESRLFDRFDIKTSGSDGKTSLSHAISWSFLAVIVLLPIYENSDTVYGKKVISLGQVTKVCALTTPPEITLLVEDSFKDCREFTATQETDHFFFDSDQLSEGRNMDSFVHKMKMSQPLQPQIIANANSFDSSIETGSSLFIVRQANKDSLGSKQKKLSKISQNTNTDSIKKANRHSRSKNFSFYLSAAPALNYFFIDADHNDQNIITGVSDMSILDKNRLAYSLEAGLQLTISKHITGYAGVSFLAQKSSISYHYYNPANLQISSGATASQYDVEPVKFDHQFDYSMRNLGIQGGILYDLQGDHLQHKVGFGLSYQLGLLGAQEGSSYTSKGSSYLFGRLLYRLECPLTNKIVAYIQPQYDLSLWANEQLNEPMKIKSYRVGFSLGIVYSFTRNRK